jgi:hypothetical protein
MNAGYDAGPANSIAVHRSLLQPAGDTPPQG